MELVAWFPIPIQFGPQYGDLRRADELFRAAMHLKRLSKSVPRSAGKLSRCWSRLGFKRVATTDVFALSTSLILPKLEDICDMSLL
jgi:hypothetical protein